MLVFFGMHGAYSATALRALVASGLVPALVIVGVEAPKGARGPVVRAHPAAPGWWDRHVFARRPRTNAERPGDLVAIAHGLGVDAIETSDPDAVRVRAAIVGAAPELFVVAGFPRLLSPRVLALAPRGGLNVHPGALPAERGPAPLFWALREGRALADGRARLAWTIHVLDAGEDSGDVVAHGHVDVTPGTPGREILRRLAEAASAPLVRAVRALRAGDLVRVPQDPTRAARRPRPRFRDGAIDATRRAVEVYTFVAACAEDYALFVESAGDRFFVRAARSYAADVALPSEYLLTGDVLLLGALDGIVELELRPDGALFSATYEDEPLVPPLRAARLRS